MSGLERARKTLIEFGHAHGVEDFNLDAGDALSLHFGDIRYVFQYNAELNALVLMAAIGKVPYEARGLVFEQLLSANMLWDETGGCVFAFEPSEEQVVMQYNLSAATIDCDAFTASFDKLRPVAREWRDRLKNWVDAELHGPRFE